MKILLVNPPCRIPTHIPLGLGYIASVLRADGHHVTLMDLNAENRPFPEIEKELERIDCGLIGIGGLTTTYKFVKEFSSLVKKIKPKVKIMAGNMVSSAHPKLLLDNSEIDICVFDEGEETVRELANKIAKSRDTDNVKGIFFKKNQEVLFSAPRERIKDLDKLPFPAWDLFAIDIYANNVMNNSYGKKSINVSTVRGCPFKCVYCSRPFGSRVYMRSSESIVSEIKALKARYNIQYIAFSDDLFILKRQRVMDLCDILIKERVNIEWAASGRVNLVDRALLRKMRKAGCRALGYGFESGSQKILDIMKKGADIAQAERAIELTRKAKISVEGAFMFGMIGETEETINETVEFIKRTDLDINRLFYTTPYPGTPLYDMAKKKNRIPEDEDKYVSSLGEMYSTFLVNLTDMEGEKLKRLKEDAEKKIRKNFSVRVKLGNLKNEAIRIWTNMKKNLKKDGIFKTISWIAGKTKMRLSGE